MDIKMRVIVVVTCLAFANCAYGMQWGYKNIKVYALPGFGGYKEEEQKLQREYAHMLFDNDATNVTITPIITPLEHSDLGQTKTMNYISSAFAADQETDTKKYDGRIILASSQAAAAVIKLMSQNQLNVPNLKVIFFEGLFMSANDAFHHSIHGERPEEYEPLREKLGVRWWAPYVAQLLKLPHYKPEGNQPIHFLSEVADDVPMIAIIHGKKDQRVTHDDAMVFYTQLQQQGKKDLYLLSKEAGPKTIETKRDHVNVLTKDDVPKVHAILRKCGILLSAAKDAREDERLLSALQPKLSQQDIERYTNLHDAIHKRHTMHVEIAQSIEHARDAAVVAAGAAAVYVAVKILTRNRRQVAESAASMSALQSELLVLISMLAAERLE
jgi:hypothetical protein